MSNIPKHERKQPKKPKAKESQPAAPGITLDVDMTGVEVELQRLANAVHGYAHNATIGENSLALFTGSGEAYSPVRLVLEGDALDSIADSFKRIADAMAGEGRIKSWRIKS